MNDTNAIPDPAADIRFRKLKRERPLRVALDRLLPGDHMVRSIERFVSTLDFTALYERIQAREGRPGIR